MTSYLIRSIFIFVGLVLVQSLLLNFIILHGDITPFIYPMFILLLPLNTPAWLLLISGFSIGLFIDMFYNSGGVHAFATVFMAYARSFVIRILTPKEGYEVEDLPRINSLGVSWVFFYTLICVFIHHFFLFNIEVLSINYPWYLVKKIFLNSIVSIALIMLVQFLFYPRHAKRLG